MTSTSGSKTPAPVPVRHRRPRAGERNRGAVDALQTKIAVNVQQLDPGRFHEQLRDNIGELPDATGCDAAFLALFKADASAIETVFASGSVFSSCNPAALEGEAREQQIEKLLPSLRLLCLGALELVELRS